MSGRRWRRVRSRSTSVRVWKLMVGPIDRTMIPGRDFRTLHVLSSSVSIPRTRWCGPPSVVADACFRPGDGFGCARAVLHTGVGEMPSLSIIPPLRRADHPYSLAFASPIRFSSSATMSLSSIASAGAIRARCRSRSRLLSCFTVTSRRRRLTRCVAPGCYATSDGTATAGADYEAVSGAVRFAPGETQKTVSVRVLNDAHDEGSETLTLTLSRPFGAELADATATGTIVNTDPIPKAWITRFGRTVGSQVVDAVTARFDDGGRSHVTVGGMGLAGSGPDPVERPDWDEWDTKMDAWGGAHEMTERELLLGSSFHLTSRERAAGGPAFAAWGRVASDGFEGDVDDVKVDGDVTTGLIGFDAEWDRMLAGLLLSQSRGEGSYTLSGDLGNDRGTVESTLTGVYPYP